MSNFATNGALTWSSEPLNQQSPKYVIAFDGGGTKCRGRLVTLDGKMLAEVIGGMGNVHLNSEEVIDRLIQLSFKALSEAGLPQDDISKVRLSAGLAGFEISSAAAQLKSYAGWPFHEVLLTHDTVIACLGAHNGSDGGILIIGTGFCGCIIKNRVPCKIGGWGHIVSDAGGGAWFGREALVLALKAEEKLCNSSSMLKELMSQFGHSPEKLCLWAKEASSGDFGKFAPVVFDYAEKRDEYALLLIEQAKKETEAMLNLMLAQSPPRLSLLGGLSAKICALLTHSLQSKLSHPLGNSIDGALFFAGISKIQT